MENQEARAQIKPPVEIAESEEQRASLAELLPKSKRWAIYEGAECNRDVYHRVSCFPITKKAENDMELLSDIFTWGESFLHHWERGTYVCSRCRRPLYSSSAKWKGPCVWPSFRTPISSEATHNVEVAPYNNYVVTVREVYCGDPQCRLFIGHCFDDGIAKGDAHSEARWRH